MSNNQKSHPHAESMLLYAQDALETDKPWERWECNDDGTEWYGLTNHPLWSLSVVYRRKPKAILVNGIEVPEPVRKPLEEGEIYWLSVPTNPNRAVLTAWFGDTDDEYFLHSGLVHKTKDAAVLHTDAMLKPSKNIS